MLNIEASFQKTSASTFSFAQTLRDFMSLSADAARCYRVFMGDHLCSSVAAQVVLKKPMMLYLPAHFYSKKLIFIHIPKNAGTSVSAALYGASHDHRTASFYRNLDPEFFARTPSFALVRDPYDRALSSFFFLRNDGGAQVQLSKFWRQRARHVANFEDYLLWVSDLMEGGVMLDFIMRRQSEFVCDENGRVITSHLFPLQEDQTDLLAFLAPYLVSHIPRLNSTKRHDVHLTTRHRSLIEQIYATDFDLFDQARSSVAAARRAPA